MLINTTGSLPDMLNTPGIYYAVSYWIAALIFLHTVPGKLEGWKKWGLLIGAGGFLSFFMTVTKDMPIYLFVPLLTADIAIILFMFLAVSDLDFPGCIYYTCRSFILGEFAASLGWQLLYFGLTTWHLNLNILANLIFVVPVYLIVFGIAWFTERKFKEKNAELDLSFANVASEVLITIFIYTFSNLSFVARNTPFSARYTTEILLLRTTLDFAGVAILLLYHIVLRQMQASMEAKTLQNMLDTQYANYRTSRDSIDLVNQKYHDLKHQIAILRSETDSDTKLQYLDKMESDIKKYEAENKTGNNILDIILTSKSLSCQRHHTELTVVADGSAIDFMEPMDISSFFGNALDNAIESVRHLENYSERLIHLTVVHQKAFVHITVENRFAGEVHFRNGLPVTTKQKEVGYHGFGVKSMKNTIEKYGGSLTVMTDNGWFRLNALMPYREKKDRKENA